MPHKCNYGKLCLWLWNGKRIEHLLLERLDNLIEIEIDSKPETLRRLGDGRFAYIRKQVVWRIKVKTSQKWSSAWLEKRTENYYQFKESCYETSRHKQNNDDVIALLKEEISDFVKVDQVLYKITHHHG